MTATIHRIDRLDIDTTARVVYLNGEKVADFGFVPNETSQLGTLYVTPDKDKYRAEPVWYGDGSLESGIRWWLLNRRNVRRNEWAYIHQPWERKGN